MPHSETELTDSELRWLKREQVYARTNLRRSAIDRLEAADRFPRRIRVNDRVVRWRSEDVDTFLRIGPQRWWELMSAQRSPEAARKVL